MLLRCIRSFYSGRCSYCVGRVFSNYAESPELFTDNVTEFHPLLRYSVSTKLTEEDTLKKKEKRKRERKIKNEDEVNELRKKNSRKTIAQEFEEYFMQKPSLAQVRNLIPEKYMKRRRKTDDALYLIDQDVADQIVESIKEDVIKEGSFVLEGNPGLGLLSEKLLQVGVQKLHLFETCPSFLSCLKNLQGVYPDKISITPSDIFAIWKLAYQDNLDHGNRVEILLSEFPRQDWSEESSLKIVGAVRSTFFLKHLMLSIVFQNSLMEHCRPTFYLILPASLYEVLIGSTETGYFTYRCTSVLFQLFFDYELLDKLPREAFLPWSTRPGLLKSRLRKSKARCMDQNDLYLMKIVPKKDVYETVAAPDKMQFLWFFVRQHMQSRRNRVIPKMETWIPNCGPRLILDGYNIFTEFGELPPHQILNLFHQFIQWPEFPESSFVSSVEMALLKMTESADESVDKSEDIEEKLSELEEHE